jgi:Ca2+-binding EF-hand superfamily protein
MGTSAAKAAEKKRILHERKRERQAQLQLQVDEWFERFDEDQNKQLDRNELRKLLTHLHPDTPVEEEALDYLIKRATEIVSPSLTLEGSADGLIPKVRAVKTVTRYSQYLKNKRELDELLKRFDSDGNGKLEPEELAALLREPHPAPIPPLRCRPEPPITGKPNPNPNPNPSPNPNPNRGSRCLSTPDASVLRL